MFYLNNLYTIFLLYFVAPNLIFANSWYVLPWSIKTGNHIRIESIPYRIYEGGDLGITKVYKYNKLLYSIEKYMSSIVLISKSGEYLVNIQYGIWRKDYYKSISIDGNGDSSINMEDYSGEAIKIYKNGKEMSVYDFKYLAIDTSKLGKNYDQFYWLSENPFLCKFPVYIKDDTLNIFTIDNQILTFDLSTNKQLKPIQFDSTKGKYYSTLLPKFKIKIKKKNLSEKFILPKLKNGRLIEDELADFLNLESNNNNRDSAILQIYIHTLLINREGKCEICYVSPYLRQNTSIDFYKCEQDLELNDKIENWFYQQKFQTKLIPKYTDKYVWKINNYKIINKYS
jgi:hypothetical protein